MIIGPSPKFYGPRDNLPDSPPIRELRAVKRLRQPLEGDVSVPGLCGLQGLFATAETAETVSPREPLLWRAVSPLVWPRRHYEQRREGNPPRRQPGGW